MATFTAPPGYQPPAPVRAALRGRTLLLVGVGLLVAGNFSMMVTGVGAMSGMPALAVLVKVVATIPGWTCLLLGAHRTTAIADDLTATTPRPTGQYGGAVSPPARSWPIAMLALAVIAGGDTFHALAYLVTGGGTAGFDPHIIGLLIAFGGCFILPGAASRLGSTVDYAAYWRLPDPTNPAGPRRTQTLLLSGTVTLTLGILLASAGGPIRLILGPPLLVAGTVLAVLALVRTGATLATVVHATTGAEHQR